MGEQVIVFYYTLLLAMPKASRSSRESSGCERKLMIRGGWCRPDVFSKVADREQLRLRRWRDDGNFALATGRDQLAVSKNRGGEVSIDSAIYTTLLVDRSILWIE
jgi:hypothetical protein